MASKTATSAPQMNGRRTAPRRKPVTTAAPSRLPSGRPKTPPVMIALCLLLMVGCGLGAASLVLSSDESVTVVAAARDIPPGTIITAEDLKAAELAGNGLSAIPGNRAGSLIGQTVLGPVPKGTLLNAGLVAKQPALTAGSVAVGLALKPGQLPAEELGAGRLVQIYRLAKDASAGGDAAGGTLLVDRSPVLSVTPGTGGGFLVTVAVSSTNAVAVSAASSAGLVAVGLLPLGTS